MTTFVRTRRTIVFLCACVVSFMAGFPAYADDTEIYVTPQADTSAPNILFIVDTSGSMGTEEQMDSAPFDSATIYDGACDVNRIYWSTSGNPPSACDGSNATDNWFPVAANTCDAATGSLSTTGQYIAQATQWRKKKTSSGNSSWRWRSPNDDFHGNDNYFECLADAGVHGQDSASSRRYTNRAASGSGADPWTTGSTVQVTKWKPITLYSGNYLNWYLYHSSAATMTRLEIVQDIAKNLIASLNGVNIGLMRFDDDYWSDYSGNRGGYVTLPVADIAANRSAFNTSIDSFTDQGSTPLSETLYEAARYFRGEAPHFGLYTSPGTSVASSLDADGKYISPIIDVCQKNNIVYLTDGEPRRDNDANNVIESLIGSTCGVNSGTGGSNGGQCLDDLAQWLHENDQAQVNETEDTINNIVTYTVGFHTDQSLLDDTAAKGGGKYYTADTYDELNQALTSVFLEILSRNGLFTAPAVSVNAFNRLEHRDELYFALFRPEDTVHWFGNLKRYRFDSDYDEDGEIVDQLGFPAVDPNTGTFKSGARSFWSSDIDGDDVIAGGMANELSLPRNVYTYFGPDSPDNVSLASYPLHESNLATLEPLLALENQVTNATSLIQWARGVDILDDDDDDSFIDARPRMGDLLHSRPLVVIYGGTEDAPDATVFATTNEGYLHAVDTSDGSEQFSFIPKELLANLEDLYADDDGGKVYGLDGPLSLWLENNGSTTINPALEGDFVKLYFGMRRGGNNYYAVDVSDRSNPVLKWVIKGGGDSGDFSEMGQSWSRASKSKVRIGTQVRDVLMFTGGYDDSNDSDTTRTVDGVGRAVYIVDAETGALIWSGGTSAEDSSETDDFTAKFNDMIYSIPSDLRIVDANGDGLADILFVGDMGGQLWRFDIDNGATSVSDLVTGGVIADIGGDDANNRRIYYPPSVAFARDQGDIFLAVAFGSGWRTHPLDQTVDDRFYMLRQLSIYGPPLNESGDVSYTKYSHDDLYNATANVIGQGSAEDADTALATLRGSAHGWYLDLEKSGEKSISDPLIANGQVMFSTYTPTPPEGGTTCSSGLGSGYFYIVNLLDATPTRPLTGDDDNPLVKEDRDMLLKRPGIPASPVVYFPPGGKVKILVGPEIVPSPIENPSTRTSWVANK